MKKVTLVLLIGLLISCETKKQPNEATEFISEILSDTTALQIITAKNTLISNFDWTPNHAIIGFDEDEKKITEVSFLSELLDEKDTLYISKQLKSKNKIDFEALKEQGFKIFDICKYSSESLSYEEIKLKALQQNKANKLKDYQDHFVMLKNPIFNKAGDKVYQRVNYLGSGTEYLFVKEKDKWSKKRVGMWME